MFSEFGVMRKKFGPQMWEFSGEIHCRGVRREWRFTCTGEKRGVYRALVSRSEGKCPVERPRCRWQCATNLDLKEIV